MRKLKQPIKVIDNFFESPDLWRIFALKQQYSRDETSTWPGVRSATLNELDMELFNSLASKLMLHIHDKNNFLHLKVNFTSVDGSFGSGWLHQDEPQYNVAGVIYLNPDPPEGTGTSFYNKISSSDTNFNQLFFDEISANLDERSNFEKFKLDQKKLFTRTMSVENIFNRCLMFHPEQWHGADKFFGNNLDDSRLTINFFGLAV
jgi:hypothetical protein